MATEDIVLIRERIEDMTNVITPLDLKKLVQDLSKMDMTLDILKKTKIGITMNKMKNHSSANEEIRSLAAQVVESWRKLTPKNTTEIKPKTTISTISKEFTGEKTGESKRDQARSALYVAFLKGIDSETREKLTNPQIINNIAEEMETSCFEHFVLEGKSNWMGYLNQIRSLKFNLSDESNVDLNNKILTGEIETKLVSLLSSRDMASNAKKRNRDQTIQMAAEACQTDYQQHQMLKDGVKGMFKCGKCKSQQTTHTQAQTRSSDEPMTTFVQCLNCGNRWKF